MATQEPPSAYGEQLPAVTASRPAATWRRIGGRTFRRALFIVAVVLVAAATHWDSDRTTASVATPATGGDHETAAQTGDEPSETPEPDRAVAADDEIEVGTHAEPPSTTFVTTATTLYDPDVYTEVTYNGGRYLCTDSLVGGWQARDCARWYGGTPPLIVTPDLYCNGDGFSVECSDLWYPDELDGYELVEIGGQVHVCDHALSGGFDDLDCSPYYGGNRPSVGFGALKCSRDAIGITCDTDYYPSEVEGLTFARIGYEDYVCRDTFQGTECYRWLGFGSPRTATMGLPDLYCNSAGECAPDGYPPTW